MASGLWFSSNVIALLDRHEIARQADAEVGEADLLHLRQQPVHDAVGGLVVEQTERDRHALHVGEPVVVQLAVRTLPARQHAGRGIQQGGRVGGAELRGFVAEEPGVLGMVQLPRQLGEHRRGPVGQRIGEGVLVAEVDAVPPVCRTPIRFGPVAEVAGAGVFDEAVAVLVGGKHLAAPRGKFVVIGPAHFMSPEPST